MSQKFPGNMIGIYAYFQDNDALHTKRVSITATGD